MTSSEIERWDRKAQFFLLITIRTLVQFDQLLSNSTWC